MAQRSRRLLSAQRALVPLMALPLLMALPATLAGCEDALDKFAQLNCKVDDTPRVSNNRVVTLFAYNYVYAIESSPDRDQYIGHAHEVINGAYEEVNRIFRDNSVNLQVVSLRTDDKNVQGMNISTFGDVSNINSMIGAHQRNSLVGVHWSERDAAGTCMKRHEAARPGPALRDNWVHLYGYIRTCSPGEEFAVVPNTGRALANAFGSYLNLDPELDKNNLMNDSIERGTLLGTMQRNRIWSAINNSDRKTLYAVTCDPPVQPAPGGIPRLD